MSTASVATFNYRVVRQFAIMTVVWVDVLKTTKVDLIVSDWNMPRMSW